MPAEALSFSGGEQAVRPAKVVTASRVAAVRARVRTWFLHLIGGRLRGPAAAWIMGVPDIRKVGARRRSDVRKLNESRHELRV
ncbi:hypothetical protein GCM10010435_67640 [Winogradskya consettensis]|uniref:Uncharacterized protein n=1 Tax=Winogradskya consettensis TaxID=113560 RepID=A0A919SLL8_9ACTN|nr:hypothetical protein Aco04nite_37130 [Actinoplanes consettensis]